jgi:predicted regulator of Ras-like GTPase activity (Roadblock/LC7/MglB family)
LLIQAGESRPGRVVLNHPAVRGSAIEDLAESDGFTIRTAGAQLADLIQINCQNRISGCFRISSEGEDAYLFFDCGHVAFAEHGGNAGLDAVASMLGLRGGVIEPCTRPWPTHARLDIGADALLLMAAQRHDESTHHHGTRLPELTTQVVRRVQASSALPASFDPLEETLQSEPSQEVLLPWQNGSHASEPVRRELQRLVSALGVVQLAEDGRVLQLKHGATEELADTAFFVYRMGALIAETLQLEACKAVYLHDDRIGLVVFKGKSVVGARGNVSELGYVLAKAGFDPSSPSTPPGAHDTDTGRATDDSQSGLRYADGAEARLDAAPRLRKSVHPALAQTELLSCVQHVRGVLGSCVCALDGRLLVSAMPEELGLPELETCAARVANLFESADESLAGCQSFEVRFEDHLLLVTRHTFGLLCVLTTGALDRALLRVTVRMAARRLEERMRPVDDSLLPLNDGASIPTSAD